MCNGRGLALLFNGKAPYPPLGSQMTSFLTLLGQGLFVIKSLLHDIGLSAEVLGVPQKRVLLGLAASEPCQAFVLL